jgi:hypothetical protein
MIYSRPASGMVFPKPRLAGPSGIIIQQDRRFGNISAMVLKLLYSSISRTAPFLVGSCI